MHVRSRIIHALVEGTSIRATARQTHTNKDAVMRLGLLVGLGCMKLHDRLVTDVHFDYVEVDEVWSFVRKHEKRKLKQDPKSWGDTYTMFAVDPDTKFVVSYATGKRTLGTASRFMHDLRKRVRGKPQISVDAWPHWTESVRRAFGYSGCHLGAIVKEYAKKKDIHSPERRYTPSRIKETRRTKIFGNPDDSMISTSMAERVNMTSRMHQRRLTRLTNAYSKKKDNLMAAVGLHFFWYNFVRVHESLNNTPAVAAHVAKEAWALEQMIVAALAEMGEAPARTRPESRRRYQRKTHVLMVAP